jgi:hypothetical protein
MQKVRGILRVGFVFKGERATRGRLGLASAEQSEINATNYGARYE